MNERIPTASLNIEGKIQTINTNKLAYRLVYSTFYWISAIWVYLINLVNYNFADHYGYTQLMLVPPIKLFTFHSILTG